MRGFVRWLRKPGSDWVRVPLGHRSDPGRHCRLPAHPRLLDGSAWPPRACHRHSVRAAAADQAARLGRAQMAGSASRRAPERSRDVARAHCHDRENRPQFARLRSHPSAMAHPHTKSQAPAPRLYLVTPPVEDAAAFARELAAALGAADVAAVLLRLADSRRARADQPRQGAGADRAGQGRGAGARRPSPTSWRAAAPMARISPASRLSRRRSKRSSRTRIAGCGGLAHPARRHDSPPSAAPTT